MKKMARATLAVRLASMVVVKPNVNERAISYQETKVIKASKGGAYAFTP